jgi:hypothetical protein
MKCWSLFLLVCLAACGDATSGPRRVVYDEFAFDDPAGDTALFAGSVDSFPAQDVRRVSGVVTSDSLTLTIDFVDPIARATTAAGNSLIAAIAIDADDDPATGTPLDQGSGTDSSFTAPFPAATGMGAEYFVFLDVVSGGDADVVYFLFPDETAATYPVTYGERSLTVQLPLSILGISPGTRFRFMGMAGNPQRLTDIIPDEGGYAVGDSV